MYYGLGGGGGGGGGSEYCQRGRYSRGDVIHSADHRLHKVRKVNKLHSSSILELSGTLLSVITHTTTFMATGPSKGGYDYEFVAPPPKSLECSVCLLTLRDPHVISCCGNEFCQACIERVQRDGKPCPLCNEPSFTTFLHKKLVREVNALVVRCPQKELGCDWEGELGQVKKHLNTGEGTSEGCGYVPVTCSYGCGVELPRHQLPKHELEVCPKRPVERQIASLVKKFDAVVVDNQLLRRELDGTHQEIQKMKTMISDLQQQNEKLKNDFEQRCSSLEANTVHLPTPPFYFAIENFTHLKSTDQVWCSDPFYSHPGGYKIVVEVYPNGFDSSKGTHMSVYVGLQRGEFDNQLQWPFSGEITIETYNRSLKQWSKRKVIDLNVQCGCDIVSKPTKLSNAGYGYPEYISHDEVLSHYHNRDGNVVSMRVVAVKHVHFMYRN